MLAPVSGAADPNVAVFLSLLIAVAIVAAIVRFVRVPYTVALVLAGLGLALTPQAPSVQLTPALILTVFLPVLLFHAAYNLDVTELRANVAAITLLAAPGVLLTAGLVGVALHFVGRLPWPVAVLFGTIVAATDPVAVLALFETVGAPRRLVTIVDAESLFNDGIALVIFASVLGVATAHQVQIGATAELFVVAVIGALVLGALVAAVGARLLRHIDDALLETTITLILAYGGYLLAQHFGSSGPLETVSAGLFLGVQSKGVMSPTTRMQARATWEFLDFLANSLLFLLVGLALRSISSLPMSRQGLAVWWLLAVAIGATVLARALVVSGVQILLTWRRRPLPGGWPLVLTWAGLRGGVSLAAALSIPLSLSERDILLVLTFGVVLFTLLVQGLTIHPLLDRLGMGTSRPGQALASERRLQRQFLIRQRETVREARAEDQITPEMQRELLAPIDDALDRLEAAENQAADE
jgi:CPA1 family monovalent cation:H+ antiporter